MLEVLRSGRLSLGPMIDRFEELVAERVGAPYAAAVSSGTAGLHLLCRVAGLGPGDEAITSPFSFVASANCFLLEGATPVFADIDPRTLNLDPAAVEAAITERTKAIVAGRHLRPPVRAGRAARARDRHGLALIDDACEALGAEYKGAPLGSQGVAAVFAFYPNKQVATGEGGVVTTHSEASGSSCAACATRAARTTGGGWFTTHGSAQLPLDGRPGPRSGSRSSRSWTRSSSSARRRRALSELLADVDGVETPLADDDDHRRSWFVYVVELPEARRPRPSAGGSRRRDREVGEYLPCIHLQPYMRERIRVRRGDVPGRGGCSRRTLALRSSRDRRRADQERVVDAPRRSRAREARASWDNRRVGGGRADGLPRLRQVRARRPDLRARAAPRRRAAAGGGPGSGSRGSPTRSSPRGPSGRSCSTWAGGRRGGADRGRRDRARGAVASSRRARPVRRR